MCRWRSSAIACAAVTVFVVGIRAQAQDESAKVERYLSRLGLSEMRVRHLEREVMPDELARVVEAIAARELDPYTAADRLFKRIGLKTDPHQKG